MLNIFNAAKNYIIAFLLIATLALGYSTYSLIGQVATTQSEVTAMTDKANKNAEAARVASESCGLSMKAVQDNQKAIDALNESRTSDLGALAAVTQITLPETQVNGSTTTTAAPKKYADDARLSPDTMRLLDNAYCSGNKDDTYCTSR